MKLTSKVRKKLRGKVILNICISCNVPYPTMRRWIANDYEKGLSRFQVMEAIEKYTGVKKNEIFKKNSKQVEL